jgi:hypothetical protein
MLKGVGGCKDGGLQDGMDPLMEHLPGHGGLQDGMEAMLPPWHGGMEASGPAQARYRRHGGMEASMPSPQQDEGAGLAGARS